MMKTKKRKKRTQRKSLLLFRERAIVLSKYFVNKCSHQFVNCQIKISPKIHLVTTPRELVVVLIGSIISATVWLTARTTQLW